MTNSEAIEWLKEIPRAYGVRRDKEPCEAFVLAIKALDENEKLNKEIPALLNRIDELQGMIARRDVEIAHLKKKEASEVTSHSEKNILNGAISLMETVFRYMIDYMDYMGFEYDNDDDEEKPRFEMSNFEIVQRLFLSRTSNSGGTSTRAKCKELDVEDDVMINFEWSEEDETNRC